MFLHLTALGSPGQPLLINVDSIDSIVINGDERDGCIIRIMLGDCDGDQISQKVSETFTEIMHKLIDAKLVL